MNVLQCITTTTINTFNVVILFRGFDMMDVVKAVVVIIAIVIVTVVVKVEIVVLVAMMLIQTQPISNTRNKIQKYFPKVKQEHYLQQQHNASNSEAH